MKYQTQRDIKSKANLEWRKKLSKKKSPLSEEHKEKIRQSLIGKNKNKKRPDLSVYNKKRKGIFKHSEESKKKTSLSLGGTGIPYENHDYPKEFFTDHKVFDYIIDISSSFIIYRDICQNLLGLIEEYTDIKITIKKLGQGIVVRMENYGIGLVRSRISSH